MLLSADDHCKLCDFGLAHAYPRGPHDEVQRTPLKVLCGSKSYAAPEVLAGKGYDGERVDVWSCGICLFGMTAGFFPLEEAAPSDWRYGKIKQAVDQDGSLTQVRPPPATSATIASPCSTSTTSIFFTTSTTSTI